MAKDDRTVFDLSKEEYEDNGKHPEKWEQVTENSNEYGNNLMYPDSDTRDD